MKRTGRCCPGLLAALILLTVICFGLPEAVYAGTQEEQTVFAFLIDEMGLNPAGACGIMANVSIESGFKADITGPGGAYGICQWMGQRKTNLINYCAQKGLNYKKLKGQLTFLRYELKKYFPSVYSYLKKVPNTQKGAYDAGYHWCYDFEMPGDRHNASVSRGQVARDTFWPVYGKASLYLTGKDTLQGIVLTWSGFPGKSCTVFRSDHGLAQFTKIGSTRKGTYTDDEVSAGRRYDYLICPTSHAASKDIKSNTITVRHRYYLSDPNCRITLGATSCVYNGRFRRPSVTVTFGKTTLKENTHFTVECANNRDAGRAVMTITGIGTCSGKAKKYYTIKKAPQVITASDFTLPVSDEIVEIPLNVTGEGTISCVSSAFATAYARGTKIVAKKPGTSLITISVEATKNYRAAKKTVTLTVVPRAPKIIRGKAAAADNGRINVGIFWSAADDPDGYVFKYMLGSAAKRIVIADPTKSAWVIHGLAGGYRWSFQVCSYKVIGGKRCYSPWSNEWTVPV